MGDLLKGTSIKAYLQVEHVEYAPVPDKLQDFSAFALSRIENWRKAWNGEKDSRNQIGMAANNPSLHGVSFDASPGTITAILGVSRAERRTLVQLLARRRKYGVLRGNISLSPLKMKHGSNSDIRNTSYESNIGYVAKEARHTSGLSFQEIVEYAVRLHDAADEDGLNRSKSEWGLDRAHEILSLVGLKHRMHFRIPEEFFFMSSAFVKQEDEDGELDELEADMRLLSIAVELISSPSVLILDDPLEGLGVQSAIRVMESLQVLTDKGLCIIMTTDKPHKLVYQMIDSVVLLMEGRSIFSGRREQLLNFFKEKMKYKVPHEYIMQERSMPYDESSAVDALMDEALDDEALDDSLRATPNEEVKPIRQSSTGDLSRRITRTNSAADIKRSSRKFSVDTITPIRGQRTSKRRSSAVFVIENNRPASRKFSTSRASVYALHDEERRGVVDFLIDVVTRMERPENTRYACTAEEIQKEFMTSEFNFVAPRMGMEEFEDSAHSTLHMSFGSDHSDPEARLVLRNEIKAFPEATHGGRLLCFAEMSQRISLMKPISLNSIQTALLRQQIILERSFKEKSREYIVLKQQFASSIGLGAVIGYFMWGNGTDYGGFCMTMANGVFPEIANLTTAFFLLPTFVFVMQVVNVHAILRKVETFRSQRKYAPPIAFGLATVICELLTVSVAVFLFSIIFFEMTSVRQGDDYYYLFGILILVALIAQLTAAMLVSIFRSEYVCRDLFLVATFSMVIISGYPFKIQLMRPGAAEICDLAPIKWAFQGLMVWKFGQDCLDGDKYLTSFGFGSAADQREEIMATLALFVILPGVLFIVSLLPLPSRLWLVSKVEKTVPGNRGSGSSIVSTGSDDLETTLIRQSQGTGVLTTSVDEFSNRSSRLFPRAPPEPVIFARESSIASELNLGVSTSATGEKIALSGFNIAFENVSVGLPPGEAKRRNLPADHLVVKDASGLFVRGDFSVIMGNCSSGKKALLHALAGNIKENSMHGTIYYDGQKLDREVPKWVRCGFVDDENHFIRDISVLETLTYAMQLRCTALQALNYVDDNVNSTLDILELRHLSNVRTKHLTDGELKRLSIAVQVVNVPQVLFITDPTVGLSMRDSAKIMRGLRSLVNKRCTVVATTENPLPAEFDIFDSLLLMSEGRVIYRGRATDAIPHFMKAPYRFERGFVKSMMESPAEALLTIADEQARDEDSHTMKAAELEKLYLLSDSYKVVNIDPDEYKDFTFVNNIVQKIKYDYTLHWFKIKLLFHRSLASVLQRRKMILGSFLMHIALAGSFVIILGNVNNPKKSYGIVSYFVVGALILMLTSIQQVFFMHSSHKVYIREQEQGLYLPWHYWLVNGIPLYLLRVATAMTFGLITYRELGLKTVGGREWFFYLALVFFSIAGHMAIETLCMWLPSLRDVYLTSPGVCFVSFFLSGVPIKSSTLPRWVAPWGPSLSIVRWFGQAVSINDFANDLYLFPLVPPEPLGNIQMNTYKNFLHFLGWGGKNKWYCFWMIAIFLCVIKTLQLGILFVGPKLHAKKIADRMD